MKQLFSLLLLLSTSSSFGQKRVEGEYQFSRQEMVAAFNFSPKGTFQFFYSYGAADRTATGSFTVVGDTVKLKSDKVPGKDFTVISQSKSGAGYTLQFKSPNKVLLQHIRCIFFNGSKRVEEMTDADGKVQLSLPVCDTIFVQYAVFPDIVTLIKDKANNNNLFIIELNPSLEQVSFKGIDFIIEDDETLSCLTNYFMQVEEIKFKLQIKN